MSGAYRVGSGDVINSVVQNLQLLFNSTFNAYVPEPMCPVSCYKHRNYHLVYSPDVGIVETV